VVFHKLCKAACQAVACTVGNPQFHCEPAETGRTIALSATSSSPAPAFRHSNNKNWPLSHLYFVSLYFRVYFLFPLLCLSFLFATLPYFLCFSLFQPFFTIPFLDLFISHFLYSLIVLLISFVIYFCVSPFTSFLSYFSSLS